MGEIYQFSDVSNWLRRYLSHNRKTIQALEELINGNGLFFTEAMGEPGMAGNPIKIYEYTQLFENMIEANVKSEITFMSFVLDEELFKYRELHSGLSEMYLSVIEQVFSHMLNIEKLHKADESTALNIKIDITDVIDQTAIDIESKRLINLARNGKIL
jgi:hypothetical protein